MLTILKLNDNYPHMIIQRTMQSFINYLHLECITSGRAILTPEWNHVNYNNDNFARIHLIEEGAGAMLVNGRWYDLLPGKLHVIPDAVGHEYICHHHMISNCIFFRAKLPGGINLLNLLDFPLEYDVPDHESYLDLYRQIHKIIREKTISAQFKKWSILLELLSPFMEKASKYSQKKLDNYYRFRPILEAMENNLTSPPTLAQMAETMQLAPAYLSSNFKKQFGISTRQYINNLRIERVKSLLDQTDFTLDHIASEVGYYDAYHLSKTFSKATGTTPGKFRKRDHSLLI